MTAAETELHFKALDRCQDKRQREDYIEALARSKGNEYASAVKRMWFELHCEAQPLNQTHRTS